ncbi:hypothetical protein DSO57_1017252 [Entomophthora muscae]|uniref:Uncharacterized protein n=1 Tax=Entomophthora muscae TaxID=34485 RepID=A0ACC2TFK2_9FUNG|nr:hypothetical protein DSO57_1017252 [Entomophthora muscae]
MVFNSNIFNGSSSQASFNGGKAQNVEAPVYIQAFEAAHTVDERFVLAYPAEPLPLVAPSWEETLVNLDYLLAWYCSLQKTIRAGQSEAATLALSNTSEFQITSASSSQSDLTAEIGIKPSSPPAPA